MVSCPIKKSMFHKNRAIFIALSLILAIGVVYAQALNFEFTNFDDNAYVTGNGRVKSGLTLSGLVWSLHSTHSGNWHPLTWLSHMLDAEFYGLNAGGHHLTNVLFHMANTLLLFFLLRRITDTLWRSAIVAALFALHPLHVESVAWVAERKDVLSTFFGMLALISYVRYIQQRSRSGYGLALLCFMLALLAKPMLVTLPFVLLLLDYWPLGRINFSKKFRLQPAKGVSAVYFLLREKIPFFILTAASCAVTYYAQQSGGAMLPPELYPLDLRISNAIVAYLGYIGKLFWPAQLAVFYPYPDALGFWQVSAAAAVLLGLSAAVLVQIRQRPYLTVGWFWYVGTLVPVIGLVQVGGQAMADRYTYVPLIGLFIIIAWGAAEIFERRRVKRIFAVLTTVILMLTLSAVSHQQVAHWTDSITLFSHALKGTRNNYLAHLNLGKALNDAGKDRQALQHYRDALHINPNSAHAHLNFANALLAQGEIDEASRHFFLTLRLNPDFAQAHNNLGIALMRKGKIMDAIFHFRKALGKNPNYADAARNLNLSLAIRARLDTAVKRMRTSLGIDLQQADLNAQLAELTHSKRAVIDAIEKYRQTLVTQPGFNRRVPDNPPAVETVMQEYEGLLSLLHKIVRIEPECVDAYYHIASIYARKGKAQEAQKWLSMLRAIDTKRWDFFKTDPDLLIIN